MGTSFTIGNALSYGWGKMKEHFTLFLSVLIIILGVQLVRALFNNVRGVSFIIGIAAILIGMIFQLGIYRIILDILDQKKPAFNDLISQVNLFPDYLIGTVLYLLIIVGGLILLIVPGIVWAIKYQYYGYLIVDKKMSPWDAIKKSGQLTQGHKWRLLGVILAIIGVNIVGALALLVGLFTTIPTTMMANGYVYRTLAGKQPAVPKISAKAVKKKKW